MQVVINEGVFQWIKKQHTSLATMPRRMEPTNRTATSGFLPVVNGRTLGSVGLKMQKRTKCMFCGGVWLPREHIIFNEDIPEGATGGCIECERLSYE